MPHRSLERWGARVRSSGRLALRHLKVGCVGCAQNPAGESDQGLPVGCARPVGDERLEMNATRSPELVCPAGSLRSLQLAVDAGADAVYMGLKDVTNARNFAGLNFDQKQARQGVQYARDRGRHVLMALNTYAQADALKREDEALLAEIELNTHTVLLYKALGGGWSPDPAPKSEPIPVAQWLPTE